MFEWPDVMDGSVLCKDSRETPCQTKPAYGPCWTCHGCGHCQHNCICFVEDLLIEQRDARRRNNKALFRLVTEVFSCD